jgi:putative DNA primase/helicase
MKALEELSRRKRLPLSFLEEHGLSDADDGRIRIDYGPSTRVGFRVTAKAANPSFWDMGETKNRPIRPFTNGSKSPNCTVILVEGPTDALSAWWHDVWAIGIPGATMAKCLRPLDVEAASKVIIVREPGSGGQAFVTGAAKRLRDLGFTGEVLETTLSPFKDLSAVHLAFAFHDVFMHFLEKRSRSAVTVVLEKQITPYEPEQVEPFPAVLLHDSEEWLKVGELDAAQAFARHCCDRLRYCAKAGGWHIWNKQRWKLDDDGATYRLAYEFVQNIGRAADSIKNSTNRKNALALASHLRNRRGIENLLALAAKEESIVIGDPERFDSNPWIFNVANGTLDLRTGELRPHDPAELITKIAPVEYDAAVTCPRWKSFVEEIFGGDRDMARFLQAAIGYSLSGSIREQIFLILHGSGANGKSTLLSILGKLLGDYAQAASPETFIEKRTNDGARNDLARLRGARLVTTIETSERQRLAANLVKAITGGDQLTARFLYQEHFDFAAVFKLWLSTNNKPTFRGDDRGMARRIRLVPFNQCFEGERCDPELREKLEAELPGILTWAIEGCLQWQQEGLKSPEAVVKATEDYRQENDSLSAFFDEKCEIDLKAEILASDLYREYKSWCEQNGERPETQTWLGRRLSDRGFRKKKGRIVSWRGLRLTDTMTTVGDS